MPVFVSLHTCFTWPFSVDFDVFKLYLEGYSVEEAVEERAEAIKTANAHSLKASYRFDQEDQADENTSLQQHETNKSPSGVAVAAAASTTAGDSGGGGGLSNASMLKMEGARKDEELLLPISAATCVTQPAEGTAALFHAADTKTNVKVEGGVGDTVAAPAAAATSTVKGEKSKRKEHKHRHNGTHHSKKKRKDASPSQRRAKAPRPFYMSEEFLDFQNRVQCAAHQQSTQIAVYNSKLLHDEVNEQYELFNILQEDGYLSAPYAFLTNHYLPIPVPDRCRMVEMYYDLLAPVCCCFFGSRMSKYEGIRAGSSSGSGTNFFSAAIMSLFGSKGSAGLNSERNQMYTAHNEAMVRKLQALRDGSLRRQWENIKKVCATVSLLYQGKGGLYVPRSTPLLYTVRQCYGLSDHAAHYYATMAFGYEHRLDISMMNRLRSFEEYSTICTLIASLWCDASELLLREDFVEGCQRIAVLWEENRIMAELHVLLFGESLRPRWQMQLDEMQRVITTTSAHDKAVLGELGAAHSPTCPSPYPGGVSSGVASPVVPSASPSSGNDKALPKNSSHGSLHGASGIGSPFTAAPSNNASGYGVGGGVGGGGGGGANSSSSMMVGGANTSTTPFCGNKMFTRRFMVEFPYLVKHMARLAACIGPSKNLNLALDTFYGRIYTYLESLSSRTAPAVVSKVMSLHHSRGGGNGAAQASPTVASPPSRSGGEGGESSPLSASLQGGLSRQSSHYHPPTHSGDAVELAAESTALHVLPSVMTTTSTTGIAAAGLSVGDEYGKGRSGLAEAMTHHGVINASFPLSQSMHEDLSLATDFGADGKPRRLVKSSSMPSYDLYSSPATGKTPNVNVSTTNGSFHHNYDTVEHVLEPLTSIVNTSMAHPAVTLLQMASAGAASPNAPGAIGGNSSISVMTHERFAAAGGGAGGNGGGSGGGGGVSENDMDMPLPRMRSGGDGAADSSCVSVSPSSRGSSFALHAHDGVAHTTGSNSNNNNATAPHHHVERSAAANGGPTSSSIHVPDLSVSPTNALLQQQSSSEVVMSSSTNHMPDTPRSKQAASKSKVRHLVQKALDKRYLIELCLMFNLLPTLWPQLSSISAEDHRLCDKPFVDLVLALKSITQVLMASDDYVA